MQRIIALAGLIVFSSSVAHAEWKPKKAPLMTQWAADVKPDAPLPEYPRPQLVRADWLNLNGLWEYQPGKADDAAPVGKKLSSEILVPFCVESALSGVMEHHDRLWYRRQFTVPTTWNGKQVILHFGAVDYETEVLVNGKSVGVHRGGYDPFSFDVTSFLSGSGPQELIVRVFDPTNDGGQPRGKQSLRPGGIMYTPTTGIWQTVWLEPITPGGIASLKITPDVDAGVIRISTASVGGIDSEITAIATDGGQSVGSASDRAGKEFSIKIPNAKLWSPDSPFLYDLHITAKRDGKTIDEISSYFAMRKISLGDDHGVKKMMLNGKFVFEIGPLDQGFWPDGIYTQPTEAALKFDLQTMKDLGFNMVRKHIKVEPARWYYWTDHLGLLVWQDMPSANSYDDHPTPPVDKEEYKSELMRIVEALRNVPSIIMWDTFNESQGQHDTKELVAMVKEMDPTRLVNQASGGDYKGAGDVYDIHSYPPPNVPQPNPAMALACGEYGGIGRMVKGHLWSGTNGGYMNIDTPDELVDTYMEFSGMLKKFRDEDGMSAAVYTQITDVETELNGLLTYDRIPKMDVKKIAKANHFEITIPVYKTMLETSEKQMQMWKYTTSEPSKDWSKTTFDDKTWRQGSGGFGALGTPGMGLLGTDWTSSDIWLRRTFNPGALTPEEIAATTIRCYHDEDVDVFINGVHAYHADGFNGRYENRPISNEARKAMKPNAENVITVHCKQTVGGQYVDVGLVAREPDAK